MANEYSHVSRGTWLLFMSFDSFCLADNFLI